MHLVNRFFLFQTEERAIQSINEVAALLLSNFGFGLLLPLFFQQLEYFVNFGGLMLLLGVGTAQTLLDQFQRVIFRLLSCGRQLNGTRRLGIGRGLALGTTTANFVLEIQEGLIALGRPN